MWGCKFSAVISSWIWGDSSWLSGFVGVMAVAPGWKWKLGHWREGSREGMVGEGLVWTLEFEDIALTC